MKEVCEVSSKYANESSTLFLRGYILREIPLLEFPFLEYSVMAWISQAERVEGEKIAQNDLLNFFQWPSNQILETIWSLDNFVEVNSEDDVVEANSEDDFEQTPLLMLAQSLKQEMMQHWLERSCVAKAKHKEVMRTFDQTPLLMAAQSGNQAVMQLLLERANMDASFKDDEGWTPLLFAAIAGHKEVVGLLLERNDVKADSMNDKGRTPLLFAWNSRHTAVVLLLLKRNDVEVNYEDLTLLVNSGHVRPLNNDRNAMFENAKAILKHSRGRLASLPFEFAK